MLVTFSLVLSSNAAKRINVMSEYFLENTIARFFDLIQYVALFSVPVIIVWLVMNARKKQLQMKYDIIMKSLDNGVQVDPKELLTPEKSPFTSAVNKLRRGIIEGGTGLFLAVFGISLLSRISLTRFRALPDDDAADAMVGILLIISVGIVGIVLLSIGIANIASYIAYKRQSKSNENSESANRV